MPPSAAAALTAAAVVWGLRIGLEPLSDNSFLTHLAAGRLILDGGIPTADPFSWTAPGTPWVVQSWLAAGAYALAERLGGGHAVLALQASLTVVLALLVVRLTSGLPSLVPRVALVGLALGVGTGAWAERPFLFGLVAIGLTLLVVERGGRGAAWLLPLYAVWANVHGSFPLGLVLLATVAVGARLDRDDAKPVLRALAWATGGTLLAALGPLGPGVLLFPLELLGRNEVLARVVEWRSPAFQSGWERLFLLQALSAVVLLVRRPSWRRAVPMLVFSAAAFLALRNVAVASLVLLPGMAEGATGLGSIDGRRRGTVPAFAVVAATGLAAVLVAGAAAAPAYDLDGYPRDQFALLGEDVTAERTVVAPDWAGNWLEATLGTGANVFFDDRYDMYPADVAEDYLVLAGGGPTWQEVLDRRGVDVVVWERGEPLASLLAASPDWHVAAAGGGWVTAERRPSRGDGSDRQDR